jgi:hypothetical protein
MTLRVHIDHQRLSPFECEEGREINRRRGLPASTLLVHDRNRSHAALLSVRANRLGIGIAGEDNKKDESASTFTRGYTAEQHHILSP